MQWHIPNLVRVQYLVSRSLASLRIRLAGIRAASHISGGRFCRSHLVCVPVFLVGLETSRVLVKDPGRAEEKPNRGEEDFSRLGPLSKVTLKTQMPGLEKLGMVFFRLSSTAGETGGWLSLSFFLCCS